MKNFKGSWTVPSENVPESIEQGLTDGYLGRFVKIQPTVPNLSKSWRLSLMHLNFQVGTSQGACAGFTLCRASLLFRASGRQRTTI